MVKLSMISPAHREHQRYLVFEIISDKSFQLGDVVNSMWSLIIQLFGDAGSSELIFWMPSTLYNRNKKRGIIKTDNTSVEKIRCALSCIKEINRENIIIKVLGITGTIEVAKRKFMDMDESRDTALTRFNS